MCSARSADNTSCQKDSNYNNNNNNRLKSWSCRFISFSPPAIKPIDMLHVVRTVTLTICIVGSIALPFIFAFSPRSPYKIWAGVKQEITTTTGHLDVINNYKSNNNQQLVYTGPSADDKLDVEEKTNLSHLLFGIGGTAISWPDRRRYTELWWTPEICRGYVWLDEKPGHRWPSTSPEYKVSGDTSKFKYSCWYGSRSAVRIARIVKESFELGLDNVRWFVMGDDDTVFFTDNLLEVLRKYDHNQMYYVGGNSESVEQDVIHSYTMAYGGAGFAISYPLAKELVRVLDGCIDRYDDLYGSDQKIQGCLSEIGVPVTKELGFHQMDVRGSPYGLLAAHPIAPLVSLHHLDYIDPIFPNSNPVESVTKLHNAYKTDPSRTLQHSFCYDLTHNWSISVSWGYTIQLYPSLLNAKTLETVVQTFQTWRSWSIEPFTFNTRPLRDDLCTRPVVYFLDRVERVGPSRTVSTYRRIKADNVNECETEEYKRALAIKYFNISAPTFNPKLWHKAPRRQCCEVVNGVDGLKRDSDFVRVKIRGCNGWESVTPP
ncbi:unnamed protein product [Rhodiola kirilowii]